MMNIILIEERATELLASDPTGHGIDHVLRVRNMAMKFAETLVTKGKDVNLEIVEAGALLHDVDDYKLFGAESAQNLTNAHQILNEAGASEAEQAQVVEIIRNMGYSKSLKGVRPVSLEGKIVSDADLCEAIGSVGILRAAQYSIVKGMKNGADLSLAKLGSVIFDPENWPDVGISHTDYTSENSKTDTLINHFFEKLFKVETLCLTEPGKIEAAKRTARMANFLDGLFEELDVPDWHYFLADFLKNR